MDASLLVRLAGSGAILLVLLLIRALLLGAFYRRIEEPDVRALWRQVITTIAVLVAVTLIGRIWFAGFGAVVTMLSLVGAALFIVNKEMILCLTAWPVITWRRLFNIGDRIMIGAHAGDVVDLGILYFTLAERSPVPADQASGRMVKVPNALVLTQPILNSSRSLEYVWHQVDVPLTGESNWKQVEQQLRTLARSVGAHPTDAERRRLQGTTEKRIYDDPAPKVHTHLKEGQLTVSLRFLVAVRQRQRADRTIWRGVLEFAAETEGVALAFK